MGFWQKIVQKITGKSLDDIPTEGATGNEKSTIQFNPNLIDQLESEHQLLLKLHTKVTRSIQAKDYEEAFQSLEDFKQTLLSHLHIENLKLYVYLQSLLVNSPEKNKEMRLLRKEMNGISTAALSFFNQYDYVINDEAAATFLKEWNALGYVLSERIKKEENELYTMYYNNQL